MDHEKEYPGGAKYYGLFRHEHVTERVRMFMLRVPGWIRVCRTIPRTAMAELRTGDPCRKPCECPFIELCPEKGPLCPVASLAGRRKIAWALMSDGIGDIRDFPDGKLSSQLHKRVVRITKS